MQNTALVSELNEIQSDYDMGLRTKDEYASIAMDTIIRSVSLPYEAGKPRILSPEAIADLVSKILS